jgi:hypothetical protein
MYIILTHTETNTYIYIYKLILQWQLTSKINSGRGHEDGEDHGEADADEPSSLGASGPGFPDPDGGIRTGS